MYRETMIRCLVNLTKELNTLRKYRCKYNVTLEEAQQMTDSDLMLLYSMAKLTYKDVIPLLPMNNVEMYKQILALVFRYLFHMTTPRHRNGGFPIRWISD